MNPLLSLATRAILVASVVVSCLLANDKAEAQSDGIAAELDAYCRSQFGDGAVQQYDSIDQRFICSVRRAGGFGSQIHDLSPAAACNTLHNTDQFEIRGESVFCLTGEIQVVDTESHDSSTGSGVDVLEFCERQVIPEFKQNIARYGTGIYPETRVQAVCSHTSALWPTVSASPLPLGADNPARMHSEMVTPNGELSPEFVDFALPAPHGAIIITRSYQLGTIGQGFGRHWVWNLGSYIKRTENNRSIEYVGGDGNFEIYQKREDAYYPDGNVPGPRIVASNSTDGPFIRETAGGVKSTYDSRGLLVAVGGPTGWSHTLDYDASGKIVSITDSIGRQFRINWTDNLITSIVDPFGHVRRYRYNSAGLLSAVDYGEGVTTTFLYTDDTRLSEIRFPESGVVRAIREGDGSFVGLDGPGRLRTTVASKTAPNGSLELSLTNAIGRQTTTMATAGDQSSISVSTGAIKDTAELQPGSMKVSRADGGEVSLARDPRGSLSGYTDDNGNTVPVDAPISTDIAYDFRGYPVAANHPEGVVRVEYSDRGNLERMTYLDGTSEQYGYDQFGRQVLYRDRNGDAERSFYDRNGRLVDIVGPGQDRRTFAYDDIGMLSSYTENGRQILLEHDAAAQLISLSSPEGTGTFIYDEEGRVTQIDQPGETLTFGYSGVLMNRIQSSLGGDISINHDRLGRPRDLLLSGKTVLEMKADGDGSVTGSLLASEQGSTSVFYQADGEVQYTSAGGQKRVLKQDRVGRLLSHTTASGNMTSWSYDYAGRPTSRITASGSTRFEYDTDGRMVKQNLPSGETRSITYDAEGRVSGYTTNTGIEETVEYDAFGRTALIRDQRGNEQQFVYDSEGRMTRLSDGVNEHRFEYDESGRLTSHSDSNAGNHVYEYAPDGELIRWKRQSGDVHQELEFVYDPDGRLTKLNTSFGRQLGFSYDEAGNLAAATENAGSFQLTRNNFGQVTRQNRNGVATAYDYDEDNRLVRISGRGGSTQLNYAEGELPVSVTYPDGTFWQFERDSTGHLVSVIDPDDGVTRMSRADDGALIGVTDPAGRTVSIGRDAVGRITSFSAADHDIVQFEYGVQGNLAAMGFGEGEQISLRHNANGQISELISDGIALAALRYAKNGLLVEANTPSGRYLLDYDRSGALIKETGASGRTVSFGYNKNGQQDLLAATGGIEVAIAHDSSGRLSELSGKQVLRFSYDQHGRPSGALWADRAVEIRYGEDGLKSQLLVDGKVVIDYTRDPMGRISSLAVGSGTYAIERDNRGRLVRFGEKSFAYDASGNLTDIGSGGMFEYDAANRIISAADHKVTFNPAHRLSSIENQVDFSYNALGNVVEAVLEDGSAISYSYDYRGRMVRRRSNLGDTQYTYIGDRPFAAYDGDGNLLAWLQYGPPGSDIGRLHVDGDSHLVLWLEPGVPMALLNANGGIDYSTPDPWGRTFDLAEISHGLLGYGNTISDPQSGLVFMQARTYYPAIGRFLQPDPVGLRGGTNLFAYAHGDPLTYVDPSGTTPGNVAFEGTDGPYILSPHEDLFQRQFQQPSFPTVNPDAEINHQFKKLEGSALKSLSDIVDSKRESKVARQLAQQTLDLLEGKHVLADLNELHPEHSHYLGSYNTDQPIYRTPVIHAHVDAIKSSIDKNDTGLIAGAKRLLFGRDVDKLARSVAGVLVHESYHAVQHHRHVPTYPVVREAESLLAQSRVDPGMAGTARTARDIRPSKLFQRAAISAISRGKSVDPLTNAVMYELMKTFNAELSEAQMTYEIDHVRRFLDELDPGRPVPGMDGSGASIDGFSPRPANPLPRDPNRGLKPFSALGKFGSGSMRVGFAALTAYSQYMSVQDVVSGRRSVPAFMLDSTLNGIGLFEAIAGRNLLGPAGLIPAAHGLGQLLGTGAAHLAIAAMNDPNNPDGRILRYLLGIKPPAGNHPCEREIDCDCENNNPFILGQWRKECYNIEKGLREMCLAQYDQTGIFPDVNTIGTCPTRPISGPASRPYR